MSKHTPGPWKVGRFGEVTDPLNEMIRLEGVSLSGISNPETRANRNLFAAAPDLLSALIESRQVLAAALQSCAPDWFNTDADIASHHTIKQMDEAIAKAKGDQP